MPSLDRFAVKTKPAKIPTPFSEKETAAPFWIEIPVVSTVSKVILLAESNRLVVISTSVVLRA